MKNKKLISLFVAVLICSMMTSAFAAEGESPKVEPSTQSDTNLSMMALREGVVDVSVPATGKLYINPLRFPIRYEYQGEEVTDNSQIIMEPVYIENNGEAPVYVTVSVTGTVKGGLTLSKSSTLETALTSKKAFVYFEMQAVSDPNNVSWDAAYDMEKHVCVCNGSTKTAKKIVTLDSTGGGDCYGAFRLAGDCVAKPKDPWKKTDGVNVLVAFTFTPIITVS